MKNKKSVVNGTRTALPVGKLCFSRRKPVGTPPSPRRKEYLNDKGYMKPGNPGRPLGSKSKTTLLKEKLLDFALRCNLDETETKYYKTKNELKKYIVRTFSKAEILKLASQQIPKEQHITGEGFDTNINLAQVLGGSDINPQARQTLIKHLRKTKEPTPER